MMRLYNYWWLLIWPLLFGAVGFVLNMQRGEIVEGHTCLRWRPLAVYTLAFPFVVWAGWRTKFGDTEQYRRTFLSMPTKLSQIGSYLSGVKKGHGFQLFEVLFKCLISQSDIAFFTVIAAFQMICLVYIYRKYSSNYWLTFFLFVASTDYLSWMQNGMRQFTAVVIVFLCIPLIANKRYLYAFVLVLIAAQIHSTALIFLPLIFIVNGKPWNSRTLVFIAVVILAVIFADKITGFLSEALVDTAYEGDIEVLKTDGGTSIFRVLFYSVPAVLSFVFRSYLERENDPVMNVCVNLSVVTAGFYIFSYFTSGILMGAIPIYFSLSNYILIPGLLRAAFNRESVLILEVLFAIVFTAFFYYQCGPTWGVL